MANLKNYKPYTPSRRFMVWYDFAELSKVRPEKSLVKTIKKTWGRNNKWRVTTRFMWWWHKRLYRIIDFKWYDKIDIPAKVTSVEYDPYRTSRIALLSYADGEKRYVLAWKWIKVWTEVSVWKNAPISAGNRKQLKDIPEWLNVFNVEFVPFTKGKSMKSAWSFATIAWKDEIQKLVFLKLPSGEVRKFNEDCRVTIWEIWNEDHQNVVIWKAWRQRRLWRKPRVLWKNMNPVDHPHGGGEWHTEIWLKKWPKAFNWRLVTAGINTRKNKKRSTKFIVSSRTKN